MEPTPCGFALASRPAVPSPARRIAARSMYARFRMLKGPGEPRRASDAAGPRLRLLRASPLRCRAAGGRCRPQCRARSAPGAERQGAVVKCKKESLAVRECPECSQSHSKHPEEGAPPGAIAALVILLPDPLHLLPRATRLHRHQRLPRRVRRPRGQARQCDRRSRGQARRWGGRLPRPLPLKF